MNNEKKSNKSHNAYHNKIFLKNPGFWGLLAAKNASEKIFANFVPSEFGENNNLSLDYLSCKEIQSDGGGLKKACPPTRRLDQKQFWFFSLLPQNSGF